MKNFVSYFNVLLLAVLFNLTSCSKSEPLPNPEPEPEPEPVENVLVGQVTSDLTLDASVSYELEGILSIEAGASLTIPAGTTITATGADNTQNYIVVQRGAKIYVNGTAASPVILTSAAASPGSWGGLVIAGNAGTTEGVNAIAEVGGIVYGGNNTNDNSGAISYMILEYAGAQINSESQFNGLSLYAVCSGTTISNIAILNGTDDGVEFFGGSVSATNIYLENNEDDAIDWTEGWNGTVNGSYVLHTIDFSTAVEADGVNNNPKLVNLTCVSTTGGTALQFKKASGATITGLSLTGYDELVDLKDEDQGSFDNITIDGNISDNVGPYESSNTTLSTFTWLD